MKNEKAIENEIFEMLYKKSAVSDETVSEFLLILDAEERQFAINIINKHLHSQRFIRIHGGYISSKQHKSTFWA
jgi:acyl-coenzyme A thioesterase PaaI-like protein